MALVARLIGVEGPQASLALRSLPVELVGEHIPSERIYDSINVILSYQNADGGWATYENTRSYSALEVRFNHMLGNVECLHVPLLQVPPIWLRACGYVATYTNTGKETLFRHSSAHTWPYQRPLKYFSFLQWDICTPGNWPVSLRGSDIVRKRI
jgi:hypothetical protein